MLLLVMMGVGTCLAAQRYIASDPRVKKFAVRTFTPAFDQPPAGPLEIGDQLANFPRHGCHKTPRLAK